MKKGRLKKTLGAIPNYATIVGVLIGAGIFVVTGEVGAQAGPSVPLAYLVLFPVILATALPYMVFLSTPLSERPGGEYLYISRTTGHLYPGFISLWFKWMAYIGALGVLSLSFGQYMKFFFPSSNPILIGGLALFIFYVLNVLGVEIYAKVQVAMVSVLLVSVAVLVIPGLFHVNLSNYKPFFPFGLKGFTAVLPSIFFAYAAFEAVGELSAETKDQRKVLPRVFFFGILATMLIYTLMSFVAFGNLPFEILSKSKSAMADVAKQYLPFVGSAIVAIGALSAFTTSINATLMSPPRFLMILSEDHLIPPIFSHVNKKFKTPDLAITLNFSIALILLMTRTLNVILAITLQALFINYLLMNVAVILLPFLNKKLYNSALTKPKSSLMIAASSFSTVVLLFFSYKMIIASWETILMSGMIGTAIYFYSIVRYRKKLPSLQTEMVEEYEHVET